MATIRRVTIHRLRNVTPGCTFELHPGLNVLLGQNGTGKTTLLQWMADCLSGDLQSWSNAPYHVEVEMEATMGPESASLQMLVDNEILELPLEHGLDHLVSLTSEPPRTSLATARLTIRLADQLYEIWERPNQLSLYVNGALLVESESAIGRYAGNMFGSVLLKAISALKSSTQTTAVANEAAKNQTLDQLTPLMRDVVGSYPPGIYRFDESLGFFHRIVAGPESKVQVVSRSPSMGIYQLVPNELHLAIRQEFKKRNWMLRQLPYLRRMFRGFSPPPLSCFSIVRRPFTWISWRGARRFHGMAICGSRSIDTMEASSGTMR